MDQSILLTLSLYSHLPIFPSYLSSSGCTSCVCTSDWLTRSLLLLMWSSVYSCYRCPTYSCVPVPTLQTLCATHFNVPFVPSLSLSLSNRHVQKKQPICGRRSSATRSVPLARWPEYSPCYGECHTLVCHHFRTNKFLLIIVKFSQTSIIRSLVQNSIN